MVPSDSGIFFGIPRGYRNPPEKYWAKGGTDQPLVGWCAPYRPNRRRRKEGKGERKGEDSASPFPSLPFAFLPPPTLMEGREADLWEAPK